MNKQQGFTLIEIMVVIVVIGLLAAIVAPRVLNRADDAAIAKAKVDVSQMMSAMKLYRLDNFKYPSASEGLRALVEKPDNASRWKGPYIELLPKDPWDNDYYYSNPSAHGAEIDIYSLGADNAEGGEGINADIGNWNLQ